MRLSCEVETTYNLAQTAGMSGRGSRARASISLGKKAGGKEGREEFFLLVSTTKNVAGMKYKINSNVERVFARFLKDGMVTIRFKEPAHELSLSKADPVQLRELLKLLKLTPNQQKDVSIAPLLPPKMRDLDKPPTRLIVKSRGQYPLNGFPSSLENVQAVGIGLNRVDSRLMSLSSLHHLDLSSNLIKTVPEGVKDLNLVELRLSGNKISEFPEVLCSSASNLAKNLRTLDMSRNQLSYLPSSFSQLKLLVQLKLDCNELQTLPRSFGRLVNLRFLSVSSNKLAVLPHSFVRLSLESLDLFGNPFQASGLARRCSSLNLPSLQELTARAIRKHKVTYSPETVPVVLCHYLDSAKRCVCGTACFAAFLHYIASMDLQRVSTGLTAVDKQGSTSVPVELFLCSARCLKLWNSK